jgi:hypothetical protein
MTFILNILRQDMSILAADRRAVAKWPNSISAGFRLASAGIGDLENFNKIHLNATRIVAVGVAGDVQDHGYTEEIEKCPAISDTLRIVRNHMEHFLRIDDRANLSVPKVFTVNQAIASFFDPRADAFFSNTFLFTPVRNETRLHRASEGSKVLCAGTGSAYYEDAAGKVKIDSLFLAAEPDTVPHACIQWIWEMYKWVNNHDEGTGAPEFDTNRRK